MALSTDTMSAADIAAITGNNNGWGNEGGAYWLLILFLFCFMGWGNGGWNNNNAPNGPTPYQTATATQSDVQRGFDQSAVISGINGISQNVNNGFANAEVSRCNMQGNILQQMGNYNSSATQQMGNYHSDTMQQMGNNHSATMQQFAQAAYNQQGGVNAIQQGLSDIKYIAAKENCDDRNAMNMGFQQLEASVGAKTQAILDKLCQQEISQKDDTINQLRQQLYLASLTASQGAQTAAINGNTDAQAQSAVNQLRTPSPVPAYLVGNPSGCNCGYNNYSTGCCA